MQQLIAVQCLPHVTARCHLLRWRLFQENAFTTCIYFLAWQISCCTGIALVGPSDSVTQASEIRHLLDRWIPSLMWLAELDACVSCCSTFHVPTGMLFQRHLGKQWASGRKRLAALAAHVSSVCIQMPIHAAGAIPLSPRSGHACECKFLFFIGLNQTAGLQQQQSRRQRRESGTESQWPA